MNAYQIEQLDAQRLLELNLRQMPSASLLQMADQVAPYLGFRSHVDQFLQRHCSLFCTQACFQSRMSACCSRDGIITFWADMVVNALCSDRLQLDQLMRAIESPHAEHKCIFLGKDGCIWRVRPLVCAMFLCDKVKASLIEKSQKVANIWSGLNQSAKAYRWPDRPVLFDALEKIFIDRGCRSDLMYLHNSPGLLRIKHKAGL